MWGRIYRCYFKSQTRELLSFSICCHGMPSSLLSQNCTNSRFYLAMSTWSRKSEERQAKKCLIVLELSSEMSEHSIGSIKDRYLKLVKQYHPDSSSSKRDAERFDRIKHAYSFLQDYYESLNSETMSNLEEEEVNDKSIQLRPQHRQYLSYDGVGAGSMSQRKKQYDKLRTDRATENVFQFRKDKFLRNTEDTALVKQDKENRYTRRARTSNMLYKMVDDMIKESMRNGEFDNLPGKGKPLSTAADSNPYVDTHTHKLNTVLINNGYAPEWMALESTIRRSYREAKNLLEKNYHKHCNSNAVLWNAALQAFTEELKQLNKQIDKLNIIAPTISVQMVHYSTTMTLNAIKNKCQVSTPSTATTRQT